MFASAYPYRGRYWHCHECSSSSAAAEAKGRQTHQTKRIHFRAIPEFSINNGSKIWPWNAEEILMDFSVRLRMMCFTVICLHLSKQGNWRSAKALCEMKQHPITKFQNHHSLSLVQLKRGAMWGARSILSLPAQSYTSHCRVQVWCVDCMAIPGASSFKPTLLQQNSKSSLCPIACAKNMWIFEPAFQFFTKPWLLYIELLLIIQQHKCNMGLLSKDISAKL